MEFKYFWANSLNREDEKENFINLIGIESPGLTSSLSIAKYVKKIII